MADAPWPKGHRSEWPDLLDLAKRVGDSRFDFTLAAEVQTDKELVKILPCQYCQRPLIVTTFYVLAWSKCGPCRGEGDAHRAKGSVEVVQAGRTDPALAADLTKLLVNPEFANAICPVFPGDPEHVMELKSVHHNDHYGPYTFKLIDGKMARVELGPGETVMHQCLKCRAITTYTTTAQSQYTRCNEEGPRNVKHANGWSDFLSSREEVAEDDSAA